MWHGALSVFRFELRRTMTISRVAVWLMLILFPVFIVSVLKHNESAIKRNVLDEIESAQTRYQREKRIRIERDLKIAVEDESPALSADGTEQGTAAANTMAKKKKDPPSYLLRLWVVVFFGLIPEVVTLFGLLLWVPAMVHAELEGHTWIYLAVRPGGRVSVLLGKYLTAITWTVLAGWISTTLCVVVARPESAFRLWATMICLVALASLSYGAIYTLIGVWLHRRAMVIAVTYTLICEFLVSLIPAVINKFTVQYRLRSLLLTGMDWWDIVPSEFKSVLLGNEPAWLHLLVMAGVTTAILFVAVQLIRRMEYVSVAEA